MKLRLPTTSMRMSSRGLRTVALVLALSAAVFFSYPFATDVWAGRLQRGLEDDLARMTTQYVTGEIDEGEPLLRLQIPRLGIDTIVVSGVSQDALRAGAGHYPGSALPGGLGNVAIAGHRTSYGKPFQRIDRLMPDDEIVLTTPIGKHTYRVLARPSVADPDDWSVVTDRPEDGSFLTLTSCHPEGSAAYRIWVRAELDTSVDTRTAER